MNVLSYGVPFDNDYSPLERYKGSHDIRSLGTPLPASLYDFSYDHEYSFEHDKETVPEIIGRIGRDWQPDLFLFWYPENHTPPLGIEDSPIATVALVSDWSYRFAALEYNLGRFDVVLCDRAGVEVLRNDYVKPQCLFPLYSQRSGVHRRHDVPKDIDVLYLGALNPHMRPTRTRFIERVAKLANRYNVFIGTGFKGDEYAKQLCRARIVFNYCVRGELNLRVWETLACGSLLFVEDTNPEVRDYFVDGHDLVLYNEDNLEERIQYYLEHPDEAEAIAARGHARAAEFSGENRFDRLIDWADAQQSGGRLFRQLPPPERAYQDILFLSHAVIPPAMNLEERLIDKLRHERPQEARSWAAHGAMLASRARHYGAAKDQKMPAMQAYAEAHRLNPKSAPYALNAATLCRANGLAEMEREFLEAVLAADSLEGGDRIVGSYDDEFYVRWLVALSAKTACLAMLHAEAHIRLAECLVSQGAAGDIETHIRAALDLDGENTRGIHLLAEAQWALGRREQAVDMLHQYLPERPLDMQYRIMLGQMLTGIGRGEEAQALHDETRLIAQVCTIRKDGE